VANVFLHLAFDDWMRRVHPGVPFERYADDIVAHCGTEAQAQQVLESIRRRLAQCRLEVHPGKTRIVYCKDDDRSRGYPQERFDFLGYTFRPRRSKNRWGKFFINFTPAVSSRAATKMRQEMRRWRLPPRSDKAIDDLARMWNPVLRGGFSTTDASIGLRCTQSSVISTTFWSAGPCGNTNASAVIIVALRIGSVV
jgi:RNA-directed DNA polymerase